MGHSSILWLHLLASDDVRAAFPVSCVYVTTRSLLSLYFSVVDHSVIDHTRCQPVSQLAVTVIPCRDDPPLNIFLLDVFGDAWLLPSAVQATRVLMTHSLQLRQVLESRVPKTVLPVVHAFFAELATLGFVSLVAFLMERAWDSKGSLLDQVGAKLGLVRGPHQCFDFFLLRKWISQDFGRPENFGPSLHNHHHNHKNDDSCA